MNRRMKYLYMMRSKEKLAVEVGLLYKIRISDENLKQTTIINTTISTPTSPMMC